LSDLNPDDAKFAEALALIETARNRVYQAINSELVTLHWQLEERISQKIENANSEYERGDAVILKGDLVVEVRVERARTTKDVDLRIVGTPTGLLERLWRAAAFETGDCGATATASNRIGWTDQSRKATLVEQ
jgi:hypothetical protein